MDNLQGRVNQFFIDLSLYWPQLTSAERDVLFGVMNLSENKDLAALVSATGKNVDIFKSLFLPVAEAILNRHFNIDDPQLRSVKIKEKNESELEDLQKDYCLLYSMNHRMEQRLQRLERKKAKRQAKQERVKRYFSLRGRKPWELNSRQILKNSAPLNIRLNRPLASPPKRLIKGTPEYDAEKQKLDEELDEYQATKACDLCPDEATFVSACGKLKSCESHRHHAFTPNGWVFIQ